MAANKIPTFIVIASILLIIVIGNGNLFSAADYPSSMVRVAPIEAEPDSQVEIKYNVVGAGEGKWGVTIEDSISGGCEFQDGITEFRAILLSTEGMYKSVFVSTPSEGNCTLSGDYKIAEQDVREFEDDTIMITNDGGNGENGDEDGVFKIGEFTVKMWHLIIVGLLFIILLFSGGKK